MTKLALVLWALMTGLCPGCQEYQGGYGTGNVGGSTCLTGELSALFCRTSRVRTELPVRPHLAAHRVLTQVRGD